MTGSEAARVVRAVLCRRLTAEQADQIVKAMVPVAVEPGAVVLQEGGRQQGLLVLVQGSAEIVKHGAAGETVRIATVEAPTVVGEISLITGRPHSATVRARTPCHFQLLTRSQFERLLAGESLAAYKLMATLAEVIAMRLARMDEKVVEMVRSPERSSVEELARFNQQLFNDWSV